MADIWIDPWESIHTNPDQMGGAGGYDPRHDTPMGWRVGHPNDNYAMTKGWSGQPDYAYTTPLPNRPPVRGTPLPQYEGLPNEDRMLPIRAWGGGNPNVPGQMALDPTWAGGLRGAGMGAEVTPGAARTTLDDMGRTVYSHRPIQARPPTPRHPPGWQPGVGMPGEGVRPPSPGNYNPAAITPYNPQRVRPGVPLPEHYGQVQGPVQTQGATGPNSADAQAYAARQSRIARREAQGDFSSSDIWSALNDYFKNVPLEVEAARMKRNDL